MTMLVLSFDQGEDAFDTSEIVAYETTKQRLDSDGNYNARGHTHIRDAKIFLRSGATFVTTFYTDDWQKFQEAMNDRND